MNELALFAGAGGGILGGKLLGWRTVCAVEREAYPSAVLAQRQNDGLLEPFPIWSDVTTFDGKPWRGIVDVVSGGFPCQDISTAGKGAGIDGERSGLWGEMVRIIREVRPRFCFVENSPALTSRGLGRVLGDLASLGYDVEWGVLGAHHVGAPHKRDRIWIMANASGRRCGQPEGRQVEQSRRAEAERAGFDLADTDCLRQPPSAEAWNKSWNGIVDGCKEVADTNGTGLTAGGRQRLYRSMKARGVTSPSSKKEIGRNWAVEPKLGRVAHGVAHRVDRLKAIGNGQVPLAHATAWRLLTARAGVVCEF